MGRWGAPVGGWKMVLSLSVRPAVITANGPLSGETTPKVGGKRETAVHVPRRVAPPVGFAGKPLGAVRPAQGLDLPERRGFRGDHGAKPE